MLACIESVRVRETERPGHKGDGTRPSVAEISVGEDKLACKPVADTMATDYQTLKNGALKESPTCCGGKKA
ncbi:hypothetical protein SBV1_3510005 [Verrucomicrobia bacterium]|nr:hypothetical protein SBV1_3510005 [Verrucomicrobiota bacterium]